MVVEENDEAVILPAERLVDRVVHIVGKRTGHLVKTPDPIAEGEEKIVRQFRSFPVEEYIDILEAAGLFKDIAQESREQRIQVLPRQRGVRFILVGPGYPRGL